jgi:hypothetical protein
MLENTSLQKFCFRLDPDLLEGWIQIRIRSRIEVNPDPQPWEILHSTLNSLS